MVALGGHLSVAFSADALKPVVPHEARDTFVACPDAHVCQLRVTGVLQPNSLDSPAGRAAAAHEFNHSGAKGWRVA